MLCVTFYNYITYVTNMLLFYTQNVLKCKGFWGYFVTVP
jgi:hypothetical protein